MTNRSIKVGNFSIFMPLYISSLSVLYFQDIDLALGSLFQCFRDSLLLSVKIFTEMSVVDTSGLETTTHHKNCLKYFLNSCQSSEINDFFIKSQWNIIQIQEKVFSYNKLHFQTQWSTGTWLLQHFSGVLETRALCLNCGDWWTGVIHRSELALVPLSDTVTMYLPACWYSDTLDSHCLNELDNITDSAIQMTSDIAILGTRILNPTKPCV